MNLDAIYPYIGAVIRRRRKHFNWTQEKLAARLAISRASLANIEIGRQKVLVHQLYSFAAALELAPNDLLPPVAELETKGSEERLPLPTGLNTQQREQISRLLSGRQSGSPSDKEDRDAKQKKR